MAAIIEKIARRHLESVQILIREKYPFQLVKLQSSATIETIIRTVKNRRIVYNEVLRASRFTQNFCL